jgi:hypothetical protein
MVRLLDEAQLERLMVVTALEHLREESLSASATPAGLRREEDEHRTDIRGRRPVHSRLSRHVC